MLLTEIPEIAAYAIVVLLGMIVQLGTTYERNKKRGITFSVVSLMVAAAGSIFSAMMFVFAAELLLDLTLTGLLLAAGLGSYMGLTGFNRLISYGEETAKKKFGIQDDKEKP